QCRRRAASLPRATVLADAIGSGRSLYEILKHVPLITDWVWRGPESNRRPHGFQPCALPAELPRRSGVSLAAACHGFRRGQPFHQDVDELLLQEHGVGARL